MLPAASKPSTNAAERKLIRLEPNFLCFPPPHSGRCIQNVVYLYNASSSYCVFKLYSSHPEYYSAKPNNAVVSPHTAVRICVILRPTESTGATFSPGFTDRFHLCVKFIHSPEIAVGLPPSEAWAQTGNEMHKYVIKASFSPIEVPENISISFHSPTHAGPMPKISHKTKTVHQPAAGSPSAAFSSDTITTETKEVPRRGCCGKFSLLVFGALELFLIALFVAVAASIFSSLHSLHAAGEPFTAQGVLQALGQMWGEPYRMLDFSQWSAEGCAINACILTLKKAYVGVCTPGKYVSLTEGLCILAVHAVARIISFSEENAAMDAVIPTRLDQALRRFGARLTLVRSGPFFLFEDLVRHPEELAALSAEELAVLFMFERRLKVNRMILTLRELAMQPHSPSPQTDNNRTGWISSSANQKDNSEKLPLAPSCAHQIADIEITSLPYTRSAHLLSPPRKGKLLYWCLQSAGAVGIPCTISQVPPFNCSFYSLCLLSFSLNVKLVGILWKMSTDVVVEPLPYPSFAHGRSDQRRASACQSPCRPSPAVLPCDESVFDSIRGNTCTTMTSSQEFAAGVDTPSSQFETAICTKLQELLVSCQQGWLTTLRASDILRRSLIFFEQTFGVGMTSVMLLFSCILSRSLSAVASTSLFFLFYYTLIACRGFLFWSRVTESKMRTAYVMRSVLQRWQQRTEAMSTWEVHTPAQRRRVFLESFAHIPLKAFRIMSVVDDRTYRLKHIHKSIAVKGASRLDEAAFRSFRYREPQGICKLVDVMRITLEGDAIVLKALMDRARPPRWPNLGMSKQQFVEEEATTDESDEEGEPRTALGGGNTISVSQHMEFFAMISGAGVGVVVLLRPAIALLGLLPVNTIVLNYALTLYANVYLEKLFHFLVTKSQHKDDDPLPRFSTVTTLMTTMRILLHMQPRSGGRNPLVLSTSLVDTFGMAGVIAMLDQTGIVTDMVLVPRRVLLLRPAPVDIEERSSSDDDSVIGCLTAKSEREARERKREMKKQIKRKKFREQRFVELPLRSSTRDDLAVEFTSRDVLKEKQAHLNPTCLCILLHALIKEPTNLSLWTEPFRLCDRTQRWARALHWLPRACGDEDSAVKKFTVLARIFQIDTEMRSSYRNGYPEQASSLLVESRADGALHLFTIGTPFMIAKYCTVHWTGETVEAFDTDEKTEVTLMANQQWGQGLCFETVALSHRLLPQRYHKYVSMLPRTKGKYNEYFFCDGSEVKGPVPLRQRQSGSGRLEKRSKRHDLSAQENACNHRRTASIGLHREPSYPVPAKRSRSVGDQPSEKHGRLENDDSLTMKTFMHLMVTCSQTFLGLVGLQDSVRPNVQAATATLNEAGVRCMYFCSESERQTRSFGRRVGLETEWNCCISLKNEAVKLDDRSIRAQLPFGITSIRKHLLHVDPIPLHVSLFSHAQGISTRSMLSILQDNHQVVIAVGSVFNHGNVRSFVQADLAVGVLPTRRGVTSEKEQVLRHSRIVEPSDFSAKDTLNRDQSLYRNVAELIGCSCALRAPPTTSILPILVTMIREARLRLSGIGNCTEFALHCNIFITCLNLLSFLLGIPLLNPIVTVLEVSLVVPLLSLCCTYTAYSAKDPMKTLPSRHNFFVRLAILRHSMLVWSLRYIPSLVAITALGISAVTKKCGDVFIQRYASVDDSCTAAVQGYVTLTLNCWLMFHCWTHISRHQSITWYLSLRMHHDKNVYLFQSWRLVTMCLATQVLSVSIVLLLAPWNKEDLRTTFCPSIPHVIISAVFPAVLLLIDIPVKRWRQKRFSNMQKFRKLTFGTRLGMHSPRGDYEPEGVSNETVVANTEETSTSVGCAKKIRESFFRFTSLHGGKLEMNCVCCDHIGGNYASYHMAGNA
eukprot:gene11108-7734_t